MTDVRAHLRRALRWLLDWVTPAGRAVAALGVVSYAFGVYADLGELRLVAVLCLVLFVLAAISLALPASASGSIELRPSHTTAGETGLGVLRLTNTGRLPIGSPLVEIPVRLSSLQDQTAFTVVRLPRMRRGATCETEFEIPDLPRGVLPIGPATVRRTDPLALLTRRTRWTAAANLWVRPKMVALDGLGQGFVRDLEGTPSDQVSMSDLSFHALREYVVGDDLRHVHWRSSARAGQLLVRQYHDTRRSHVVLLVDNNPEAYRDADDFELALSIAASVTARAALEEHELTLACGDQRSQRGPRAILDATCLAALSATAPSLPRQARIAAGVATDASQLVLISGAYADDVQVATARQAFGEEVQFIGFQADRQGEAGSQVFGPGPTLITVTELRRLPGLLAAHVAGIRQ